MHEPIMLHYALLFFHNIHSELIFLMGPFTLVSVPGAQLWSGWGGQSISNSNHSPTRPFSGRYDTGKLACHITFFASLHA